MGAPSRNLLRVLHALALAGVLLCGYAWHARLVAEPLRVTDGTQYWALTEQLVTRGRFAYAPPPGRVTFTRLPGYPLVLALASRHELSEPDLLALGARLNAAFDVGTALALHLLLVTLGVAPVLSLAAAALTLACPATSYLSRFLLTEPLDTLLLTAELALLGLAWRRQATWPAAAAGVTAGLAQLVRADSITALPAALALLFFAGERAWRRRALLAFALAATVVFAPWPLRNLARFGHPHPFAAEWIDKDGNALPGGFTAWLRTWCTPGPGRSEIADRIIFRAPFIRPADWASRVTCDTLDERRRVTELLTAYSVTSEPDAAFDQGFGALARARTRRDPARTFAWLPLHRVMSLWSLQPPAWRQLTLLLGVAGLVVLVAGRRWAALTLLIVPVALRTVVHAFAVPHQVAPRFLVEALPLVFGAGATAVGEIVQSVRARLSG